MLEQLRPPNSDTCNTFHMTTLAIRPIKQMFYLTALLSSYGAKTINCMTLCNVEKDSSY